MFYFLTRIKSLQALLFGLFFLVTSNAFACYFPIQHFYIYDAPATSGGTVTIKTRHALTISSINNGDCPTTAQIIIELKGGPFNKTYSYPQAPFVIVPSQYQTTLSHTVDLSALNNGNYTLTAKLVAGPLTKTETRAFEVIQDETAPVLTVNENLEGTTLVGSGTIYFTASDPGSGIQDIQVLLGSTEVGYFDAQGVNYLYGATSFVTFDSTIVRDGDYALTVRATDTAGNISEMIYSVSVNNVDDKPVVSIISPANNTEVSGNVRIRTNTTDDIGVSSLKCYINGVLLSTDTTSPYDCVINSTSFDDGPYQIAVVARDTGGNTSTTFLSLIFKNSQNDAPTIDLLSPVQGQTLKGTTKFLVDAADDLAVAKVEYYLGNYRAGTATLSPFSLDFNTRNLADGIYQLIAIAYDYEGLTKSDTAIISIRNGDYTEPGVFISSPEDGAVVSGTIELTAVAVDNVAVKEVRYYLNGEILGVRSTSPYKFTFEAATAPDGDNTITAVAVDYTGNQGTHEIHITIDSFAPPIEPEDPDTGDGTGDGTEDGTGDGTDTGTGQTDEDLNDTVASLADNLNDLVSTVNTLAENQTQLEEQVAAIQAMLTQLLEIFGSSDQSEALKANPRRGKRLTRKANRQVLRLLKASSKRAFKKRRKKARRAMRRLAKFLQN